VARPCSQTCRNGALFIMVLFKDHNATTTNTIGQPGSNSEAAAAGGGDHERVARHPWVLLRLLATRVCHIDLTNGAHSRCAAGRQQAWLLGAHARQALHVGVVGEGVEEEAGPAAQQARSRDLNKTKQSLPSTHLPLGTEQPQA
jgi:hypothetical protein